MADAVPQLQKVLDFRKLEESQQVLFDGFAKIERRPPEHSQTAAGHTASFHRIFPELGRFANRGPL